MCAHTQRVEQNRRKQFMTLSRNRHECEQKRHHSNVREDKVGRSLFKSSTNVSTHDRKWHTLHIPFLILFIALPHTLLHSHMLGERSSPNNKLPDIVFWEMAKERNSWTNFAIHMFAWSSHSLSIVRFTGECVRCVQAHRTVGSINFIYFYFIQCPKYSKIINSYLASFTLCCTVD